MNKYERTALQHMQEFDLFCAILKKRDVQSYLEIGSKHGGSLWRAANSLKVGSRIVSVDLPHGDTSFKETEPNLRACVDHLKRLGYDAHLFLGDSTSPEIINKVRALGPFEACFIDANHTIPYVTRDWENYGPMCQLVAFHDINFKRPEGWAQTTKKMPIEVPQFWDSIKGNYKHQEIRLDQQDNGIGILWR